MNEVQKRNIRALEKVIKDYEGNNIIIGSHGRALSTIINYYDSTYGYNDFESIRTIMPWIVKFTFYGSSNKLIEKINILIN